MHQGAQQISTIMKLSGQTMSKKSLKQLLVSRGHKNLEDGLHVGLERLNSLWEEVIDELSVTNEGGEKQISEESRFRKQEAFRRLRKVFNISKCR